MGRRKRRVVRPVSPLVRDPKVKERFLYAVTNGSPISHAATYAGVHRVSVHRWLADGAECEVALAEGESVTPYQLACRDLFVETEKARSDVAVRNLGLIQEAAIGGQLVRRRTIPQRSGEEPIVDEEFAPVDWRAATKLLELSLPAEFRLARQMELSGPGGGPVRVEMSEAAKRLAARLRSELGREGDVIDGEVVEDDTPAVGAARDTTGSGPVTV